MPLSNPTASSSTDGWVDAGETWTYGSADDPTYTFTIAGDKTSKYSTGMRLRVSQSTGGTKYFIVTKVAYSDPSTTMTVYGGTDYDLANETISSPYFSSHKAPFGMPLDPLKWTASYGDSSDWGQATPTQNTWYNINSASLSIPIGSWRVYYDVSAGADRGSAGNVIIDTTLSTANNSSSDVDFQGRLQGSSDQNILGVIHREKHLALTSKTTYYLNSRAPVASTANLYNAGSLGSTVIRAVCAYL